MKERPILFSAPMVRALLEGRKTMTRRIAKPVKHPDWGNLYDPGALVKEHEPQHVIDRACPYGQPGDRLWVRESFSYLDSVDFFNPDVPDEIPGYWYWADGDPEWGDWTKPKPSIHMPRVASRILLEIVSVRVERLQDITEADARAEGCEASGWMPSYSDPDNVGCHESLSAADAFSKLWETINGPGAWQKNPWVWVVEFKRIDMAA